MKWLRGGSSRGKVIDQYLEVNREVKWFLKAHEISIFIASLKFGS